MAVSGGLDSCTITRWMVEEGARVVALTADLAQPDEVNVSDIAKRMEVAGAGEAILVDARAALARAGLAVIQCQGALRRRLLEHHRDCPSRDRGGFAA